MFARGLLELIQIHLERTEYYADYGYEISGRYTFLISANKYL